MKPGCALVVFLTAASYCGAQIRAAAGGSENVQGGMSLRAGATISSARLRHKLVGKAVAAFSRSVKFANAGIWQNGALELEKAVAIDPGFSEAHGNLGVHYMALGRVEEAVREFRRAISLDPATSIHHSNLAYTMLLLRRPAEAEAEAQTALGLDSANFTAHYVLGLLFLRHAEERPKAVHHLVYAARGLPEAHLALAQLYHAEGNVPFATRELERYQKGAVARHVDCSAKTK
jgi:tetratricopeptide (TPR) repeat protein